MGDSNTPAEAPAPPKMEEVITPTVIENIVKCHNADLEVENYASELGSAVGDNYMSIMYAVTVNVKNRKTGETSTLPMMVKTLPRNDIRIQMINEMAAFEKEMTMFEQVFPQMLKFQREKGIPEEEMFKSFPKCYATFHDGQNDYIAMENLREKNFKMTSRSKGMDMDHVKLTISNLAHFHAVSYAMFEGNFDEIRKTYPFAEDKMLRSSKEMNPETKMFFESNSKMQAEILENAGMITEAKAVANMVGDTFFDKLGWITNGKCKHAVLNHGDCWTNNMMFHYDEETGKPNDFVFLDFQLVRTASRATDLNYYMHTSLAPDIMMNKQEEVLQYYHDEFTKFVQKLGIDTVEFGLSWENLQQEFDDRRYYGFSMGMMLAPMLAADSADIPDMESLNKEDFTPEKSQEFFQAFLKQEGTKKIKSLAAFCVPKIPALVQGCE